MSEIKEKIEVSAAVECDDVEKVYYRLRASLESLGFLKNLLGDFLYTDIGYMGTSSALAMMDEVKMRIRFIREATTLVDPALSAIEEYLTILGSSEEGSDRGDE